MGKSLSLLNYRDHDGRVRVRRTKAKFPSYGWWWGCCHGAMMSSADDVVAQVRTWRLESNDTMRRETRGSSHAQCDESLKVQRVLPNIIVTPVMFGESEPFRIEPPAR
jgi:hypothetical protein